MHAGCPHVGKAASPEIGLPDMSRACHKLICWRVQVLDDYVKASGKDEKPGYFLGSRSVWYCRFLSLSSMLSLCCMPSMAGHTLLH